MNDMDLQLVKLLDSEIETDGRSAMYLITCRYTNLVRVNLVVLKAFLDEKRKKGIMITIDRPHQYVSHLLQLHGIDQENLVFLDAISRHSSDTKSGAVATEFQKGPFQIDALPDFLSENGGSMDHRASVADAEFVVMDNVATLLTYNPMESVETFMRKYMEFVTKRRPGHLVTTLVMDKEIHRDLFAFVARMAQVVIELTPDMRVKMVSQGGPEAGPSGDGTSRGDVRGT